ncbi:sensor histidine kinase [Humisphaera borealis]|uniref:histidine kinase n=1 Tax=Humisphaera borealis TaxID=2807512 RepID=A0A7M2WX66_9BACT|nr:sensor histidine kinase KdpD [Humisphaera borealis]QOV89993.1 sensor histidine kinase KdpD [Humisphaera borealis]
MTTGFPSRPDPDALLAEVQQQEVRQRRGKLKIFFGMAAGVGKTYAMLEEARKRAAEGLNVLVGYAEPHIRPDTEALLLGMEILPYKLVEYRNATLKEFDVDAALARKPSLVLVDELAHSNAPGMRHAKRWQDISDLLDAGINVYSTLNVQHIESVNDIVERITGVRVRETLPDAVLEQADEVELVDIAPEELLERFREGRIYRPEQAERAAKHFFTKGNLIALREMALRTTAQRVDAQMLEARREAGVRTTWPASERVLVCIGPSPMSVRLIRSAKRLAAGLKAGWVAAYVETPSSTRLTDIDRKRIDVNLRMAEELGAQTITLSGQSIADEVVAYARAHNVTKIVIGKPLRPRWREVLFGSAVDDVIRRSGEIDIYVIRGDADEPTSGPSQPPVQRRHDWAGFASAAAVMAVASLAGWPLHHWFGLANANVLMLYLLGVLWIATHHSRAAAVVGSVLGVVAFDLLFVPPYYQFAVDDRQYIVTFLVMLLTALVISALTARVRAQGDAARQRERRTSALFALSRELASLRTTDEIASAAVRHISKLLGDRTVLLLPEADRRLAVKADSAGTGVFDIKESGVTQWVFEHEQIAGKDTATLPASAGLYVPMRASRGTIGVVGVLPSDDLRSDLASDRRQLIEAFAAQTATALERAALADEARQAWERVEAEFLRNTLLSGVSHELRTPLAAITGAATALVETHAKLDGPSQRQMLDTVIGEADRMDRLITNLLDMTRLEAGGLVMKREWQPVQEVIGSSLRQLDRRLLGRQVTTDVETDLPLAPIDSVGIEQVLVNLIDNAIEYTPAGSPIRVTANAIEGGIAIEVADSGPGLPIGTETRVFDKFFRAHAVDAPRGIGLGLAIARGIVEAHGGRISAANRPEGGAVFRFTIPIVGTPPVVDASQ